MARSPRGNRSSSGSRAGSKSSAVRPALVLDGLAVVAVVLALGITMVVSPDARLWALESLGYGWVRRDCGLVRLPLEFVTTSSRFPACGSGGCWPPVGPPSSLVCSPSSTRGLASFPWPG